MTNKEYRDNQKKQRATFKKYRKSMIRVLIGFVVAVASVTILPYVIAPLHGFLTKFVTELTANSIIIGTEFFALIAGILTGFVNAVKASNAKEKMDEYQDEEENIVDSLLDEKDKLLQKVESLEKQHVKVKEENKSKTITRSDLVKDGYGLVDEDVKVKKYTK